MFNIIQKDFLDLLQKSYLMIVKSSSVDSSMTVLLSIKIIIDGDTLTIKSTDLNNWLDIKTKIDNNSDIKQKIVINCKNLIDIVKKIKYNVLFVDIIDDKLNIKNSDSFSCNISQSHYIDQYKHFNAPSAINNSISINSSDFVRMIDKTVFASSIDDKARKALCGVNLKITQNNIIMTGCNGNKLGKMTINGDHSNESDIVINTKSLNILSKILKKTPNAHLSIDITDNYIHITSDYVDLYSKLIDAKYPDYEKSIPKNYTNKMVFNRIDLKNIIESMLPFAIKFTSFIKLYLENDKCIINVTNRDIGCDAKENINCDTNIDTEYKIGLNGKMLIEILNKIDSDNVEFEVGDRLSAVILHSVDINKKINRLINKKSSKKEINELFLLMPLRMLDE